MSLQHLRSSTANKRPVPGNMSDGQIAINTNTGSPGLFFKDSNNTLVKVGPVHVGTTAPNASPASGGTAGNSVGEQWLDTTGGTYVFKVWDGSAWRSESGTFVDVNGDVMTGALGIIAGSAGSPGLYFSGDTNTGLYSPGSDQLALATGGTGRLFVDASGRVGIGTSPSSLLHTSQASGFNIFQQDSGSVGNYLYADSTGLGWVGTRTNHPFVFGTNNSERLRITSAGNVGIGTTSPGTNIDVRPGSGNGGLLRIRNSPQSDGSPNDIIVGVDSTAIYGTAYIDTAKAGVAAVTPLAFKIDGSERFRCDSSGRLLVGTSSSLAGAFGDQAGFQTVRNDGASGYTNWRFSNDAGGAVVYLNKSRATTTGTNTIVQNGDIAGSINFAGADGTTYHRCAAIEGVIDGTPGANDMPGRLVFSTTADGASSPTERLRVTSDGYVRLSASSPGIQFNGDTAAANALNDYEEGTFTPTIVGTTSAGTGTYTNQIGRYTKIGDRVTFTIYLNWTAHTGTGNIRVSNLPFTSTSATGSFHAASIYADGIPFTGPWLQAYVGVNSTNIGMGQMTAAGVVSGIPMDSAGDITITGHYEV